MADFTLTVKTDSSAELLDIVSRIANSMPLPAGKSALEHGEAVHAEIDKQLQTHASAEVLEKARAAGQSVIDEIAPERAPIGLSQETADLLDTGRDGHGIKRDDRIHANATEPFKGDGTWKRRKNVPDEQYEEIYLELVREARAAGLYTGPAIPELELEEQMGPFYWSHPESSSFGMVDTLAQLEEMLDGDEGAVEISEEQYLKLQAEDSAATVAEAAPAPAEVAQAVPAPAPTPVPVAPAPVPPAAPAATGMSAEATPTMQQVVVKLFHAAGVNAMQEALKAMKLSHVGEATPQQLRDLHSVAENIEKLKLGDADKPTKGPEHTREALAALGYVAS